MSSVGDIAAEIITLVQTGLADKVSPVKLNRQVAAQINRVIKNLAEASADDNYVVAVHMETGIPVSVSSNNPALNGALFVCTDNIVVAEDESTAVIVQDDDIVVGVGEVTMFNDTDVLVRAARKYARSASNS